MIKLYGFGPAFNMIDPSPFVLKAHLLLTLSDIEFEVINSLGNLQKAPKGKLPFIKDGETIIADSFFISKHLKEHYPSDLDSHLSSEQEAQAHFISKAIEENLYWCAVYYRWVYEKNWPIIKDTFFGKMSFPLNKIIPFVAQRGVKKALHGHGIGRHTEQEMLSIAKQHFESLDVLLSGKQYCFGDKPSSLDATVYAFLAQILLPSIESPLSDLAKQYDGLTNYCNRMKQEFFS